jgi:DNA-binding MarR family transcriptional regulator
MRVRDSDLDAVTPVEHDDGDIGEINSIVGFHIRLAHGACYRHFTETFTDLDLTQKQVSVMWLVSDHPGISQIDLGQRLRMDRATTMTIINRLQARHYLRREKSPTDGRKQALYLDPQGDKVLAKAKRAIREHENWVKSRFSDAEVKTLMELLARIHE